MRRHKPLISWKPLYGTSHNRLSQIVARRCALDSCIGVRPWRSRSPCTCVCPLPSLPLQIGYMSTYVLLQWWPPVDVLAICHLLIFLTLNYFTLYNLCAAAFIGPGYVPIGWRPPDESHESRLQFCQLCQGFKAPRSHHCSKCGRCVKKMDHHCRESTCMCQCVNCGLRSFSLDQQLCRSRESRVLYPFSDLGRAGMCARDGHLGMLDISRHIQSAFPTPACRTRSRL